jgi:hypothetical protein
MSDAGHLPDAAQESLMSRNLKELRQAEAESLRKWQEHGKTITFYQCRHCHAPIPTRQPGKGDVASSLKAFWDTLTTCTVCGKLNFVTVDTNGRTTAEQVEANPSPPMRAGLGQARQEMGKGKKGAA